MAKIDEEDDDMSTHGYFEHLEKVRQGICALEYDRDEAVALLRGDELTRTRDWEDAVAAFLARIDARERRGVDL